MSLRRNQKATLLCCGNLGLNDNQTCMDKMELIFLGTSAGVPTRYEERRVGKEGRGGGAGCHKKKKQGRTTETSEKRQQKKQRKTTKNQNRRQR
ncbi:hypothetical protein GEP01_24045, partial [Salmonella enterica subsp. enterica serovar Anatum]|nr:hypothetical protein [Salmonella enterica subsp. enterica serovar Anatum]